MANPMTLLNAEQQALIRTALNFGIRIVIDGDRSKPTGKTTLRDYLKSRGANVLETWELEEGGAKPDNDADRNSAFIVVRLNKALFT